MVINEVICVVSCVSVGSWVDSDRGTCCLHILSGRNYFILTLVIPMCFSNTYKVQNISQNTKIYYTKYNSRATCFDSLLSHLQGLKKQIQSNQSL